MLPAIPYCDLHIHVGASVAPHVMWSIAHQQGFKLPVNNYWEFVDLITANPRKVKSLDDYLKILHEWTEKIQSSRQRRPWKAWGPSSRWQPPTRAVHGHT